MFKKEDFNREEFEREKQFKVKFLESIRGETIIDSQIEAIADEWTCEILEFSRLYDKEIKWRKNAENYQRAYRETMLKLSQQYALGMAECKRAELKIKELEESNEDNINT